MKRTFATALLTAVSLLAPAAALAESRQQAKIPFNFVVGQRVLPAGTYVVLRSGSGMITVRGWKGNELVSAMTPVVANDQVLKNPNKLIFHKYGDQYFLSEIRGELGESSGKLHTSALEQRVQRQLATVSNQGRTEIALK